MYFQRDEHFPGRWIVRHGTPSWSATPNGLLCMGMDERNDLQREGSDAKHFAWSNHDKVRPRTDHEGPEGE